MQVSRLAELPRRRHSGTRWRSISRWGVLPTPFFTFWRLHTKAGWISLSKTSTRCRDARLACARWRPRFRTYTWRMFTGQGAYLRFLESLTGPASSTARCRRFTQIPWAKLSIPGTSRRRRTSAVHQVYLAAPGGVPTQTAFSQSRRYTELDLDRKAGVIREAEHAFSQDGGLAVLFGNIASEGCVVKTAGVDEKILKFSGPALICESQDEAVKRILGGEVASGDVVVIRYEGPRGGPGMQEMLYPTSYLKSMKLGAGLRACD